MVSMHLSGRRKQKENQSSNHVFPAYTGIVFISSFLVSIQVRKIVFQDKIDSGYGVRINF